MADETERGRKKPRLLPVDEDEDEEDEEEDDEDDEDEEGLRRTEYC